MTSFVAETSNLGSLSSSFGEPGFEIVLAGALLFTSSYWIWNGTFDVVAHVTKLIVENYLVG